MTRQDIIGKRWVIWRFAPAQRYEEERCIRLSFMRLYVIFLKQSILHGLNWINSTIRDESIVSWIKKTNEQQSQRKFWNLSNDLIILLTELSCKSLALVHIPRRVNVWFSTPPWFTDRDKCFQMPTIDKKVYVITSFKNSCIVNFIVWVAKKKRWKLWYHAHLVSF